MNCAFHPEKPAVGTCVHCGKFICETCNTEIKGKNYCKKCVADVFAEKDAEIQKAQSTAAPAVFMNAGGGGASASSSSSSSSSSGSRRGTPPYPRQSVGIHLLLLFFTVGIGNIIYFFYVKSKQNQWYVQYH